MAGRVTVDGAPVTKAGTPTAEDAELELIAPPRYVSRGGEKLETALGAFGVDVAGERASTSERRPAVSRTACSSTAPRRSLRSTWVETSSTSGCAADPRVTVIERRERRDAAAAGGCRFAPALVAPTSRSSRCGSCSRR